MSKSFNKRMKNPIDITGYVIQMEGNKVVIRLPGIQDRIREAYGADILFEAIASWAVYQPDLIIEFDYIEKDYIEKKE